MQKILLVEDEKEIRQALSFKLRKAGFELKICIDGEQALSELKSGSVYDLVLLDLIMPNKDGFGTLEDMKAQGIQTPVIVLSNLCQDEDVNRCKRSGALDFIIKSNFSLNEIVKRVQTFFASQQ